LLPARVSAPAATPRAGTTPVGTTISLRLSEDATVTLSFVRRAPCRPPRQASTCRRSAAGSVRVKARAGANRVRFQGRLSARRRLALGRYVVTVTATDPAGHRSKARSASFELVRSSR
jgi:hypothetical protein